MYCFPNISAEGLSGPRAFMDDRSENERKEKERRVNDGEEME